MVSDPEISVIIPVYNVERYLPACVESVLKQSFQNFEIILVDDESPDSCPSMCDDYAKSDQRIRVIHKKNGGLGFARNSGLDVACGRYVCFLDSDDSLDSETFEFCRSLAVKENADEVRFLYRRFKDDKVRHSKDCDKASAVVIIADGYTKAEPMLDVISPVLSERTLYAPTTASSCTALYRREIIERNNIRFHSERELISEDYVFNIDFAFACNRIVYTDCKFYNYRINSSSLTSEVRSDRLEKSIVFSEYLASLMTSVGYPDAEVYAMGFTIGAMRAQNRSVFMSALPLSEQKRIFNNIAGNEYVRKINECYPLNRLPFMQRVAFRLHMGRHFMLSRIVTKLREVWKI